MPAVFLFDLDGTLIDSIELIRLSYRHTLLHHGHGELAEDWLEGLGRPLTWQFGNFSTDPQEVQRMIATYREFNLAHYDRLVCEYPGTTRALRSLVEAGGRLGIVTSKASTHARRGLACCGLESLFELVIGPEEVERPKPHPEGVLRALESMGATAGESVFVGDSPHDLRAGRDAGVRTAAALWGPFSRARLELEGPDRWLNQPREIADLVRW